MTDSAADRSALTRRVAAWSLDHRWLVIAGWILLTVLGALATVSSSSRLSFTFDLPGQPAFETNQAIVRQYGSGGDNPPLVAVVRLPAGRSVEDADVARQLGSAFGAAAAAVPGTRAASYATTHDRAFLSRDGRTAFELLYPRIDPTSEDPYLAAVPKIRAALAEHQVAGRSVDLTGATILSSGGSGGSSSILVETLLAAAAALIVLLIVFGSVLAVLPLLMAAVTIPTTFIAIYLLTYATTMSNLVQNIVALIGLGVAIDYALLICTRWREERGNGATNREAVLTASATAGASVLFSGLAVTVSLAALAITDVPFLRSIGLAGLLIPLVSIAVAATLLPVVLDRVGSRLEWPRRHPAGTVSRLWTRVAETVVGHKVLATLGALVVLGLLIAPVLGMRLGEPQAEATAHTAPSQARAGYTALVDSGIGAGVLRPIELLAPAGTDVASHLGTIAGASGTPARTWVGDGTQVVDVWSHADASSDAGGHLLDQVRQAAAATPDVRVGGTLAQDDDFIHSLYGRNLFIIVLVIVVVTFLLLARSLRSIWLPIKALALNAASLAAAFGVLTFVWQQGHGAHALFASPATGAVTLWVPLAVFALLFGLSMDYEVFILTRINEEYLKDGDTDAAIVRAIGRTGRLVSSGALILFFAFVALGGVPQTDVKILSTGLAAGVIIDATLIRGVLAPGLVALLGHYNWVLPAGMARLLRVEPLRYRGD